MEPSALAAWVEPVFRPYLRAANLNHGYRFFAPEPGPAHLVSYSLRRADGSMLEGVFPNLTEHQPRLLYHRHFMLSEFVNTLIAEVPQFPPGYRPTADELAFQANRQGMVDRLVSGIAAHLTHRYRGEQVTLTLKRHLIPHPNLILSGIPLSDPRFFETLPLGQFDAAGVRIPPAPLPEGKPVPANSQRIIPMNIPAIAEQANALSDGVRGMETVHDHGAAAPFAGG